MLPALGTNPIGINIDASVGGRNLDPIRPSKRCTVTCDHVYDSLYYFTRAWGVFTSIVLAGVGVDFIYHGRFPGYWLIAYAATIFLVETLWVLTLFLKLTVRPDHRIWQIWRYCGLIDDWKKSPLYIFMGLMTMYKPYKLWLVYLAGGCTVLLGFLHLSMSMFHKILRRRKKKDHRSGQSDLDSLESSRFEEITEVLDDGIPDPIPGSSVSLSDSLRPDHDSVLEI